jgi:hypothetical protein
MNLIRVAAKKTDYYVRGRCWSPGADPKNRSGWPNRYAEGDTVINPYHNDPAKAGVEHPLGFPFLLFMRREAFGWNYQTGTLGIKMKTFLTVPFSDYRRVKNLGAKRDWVTDQWYINQTDKKEWFSQWLPKSKRKGGWI